MGVNRRSLLKGLAVTGAAGVAHFGALPAMAALTPLKGEHLVVLVQDEAAGLAFIQGAMRATEERLKVQLGNAGLDFLRGFEQLLKSLEPPRVIGLLDDASASLVVEVARAAGARVPWLGQHSIGDAARHHVLAAETAEPWALQLGCRLQGRGEWRGSPMGGLSVSHWAGDIGYLLAAADGRVPSGNTHLAGERSPITGSFVSFAIEA